MADTITLVYSATTVNVIAPDHPEAWREDLQQVRARAMGGRVISVTRSASTLKQPVLTWTNMPDADHTTLTTFIFTTVSGSANQFTFTESYSTGSPVTYNVKYIGGLESAKSTAYDSWNVTLNLAVV
tara:strand:- start:3209 stop:3589 length:381 start_codon:yes stop_codon:yes gene_type:complete